MMRALVPLIVVAIVGAALLGMSAKPGVAWHFPTKEQLRSVPRITKEELKPMLGDPDVIILDVRYKPHWQKSKSKILGAVYEDPVSDVESWSLKYPKDKAIVVY